MRAASNRLDTCLHQTGGHQQQSFPCEVGAVHTCPVWSDTSVRLMSLEVMMVDSGRKRRVFPDAFKLEAVAAVRAGRSISEVAAELGLADRLVRSWLGWAESRPNAGRDAWVRARPTRQPRSPGCGAKSIA